MSRADEVISACGIRYKNQFHFVCHKQFHQTNYDDIICIKEMESEFENPTVWTILQIHMT